MVLLWFTEQHFSSILLPFYQTENESATRSVNLLISIATADAIIPTPSPSQLAPQGQKAPLQQGQEALSQQVQEQEAPSQ